MEKKIYHKSKNKVVVPEKTREQEISEQRQGIMNAIITETLTRHKKMPTEEYLEEIGFGNNKIAEERAIRIAKFNMMLDLTKTLLDCNQKIKFINEFYKVYIMGDFTEASEEN